MNKCKCFDYISINSVYSHIAQSANIELLLFSDVNSSHNRMEKNQTGKNKNHFTINFKAQNSRAVSPS